MPIRLFITAVLLLITACSEVCITVNIIPAGATIQAGSPAVVFNGFTDPSTSVKWTIFPSTGAGSLNELGPNSVAYTPPATLAKAMAVTLTAHPIVANFAGQGLTNGNNGYIHLVITPEPTLTISPGNQNVVAGSPAIAFTAILTNSNAAISWSLSPSGVGSITSVSGRNTSFLPPTSIAQKTTVQLRATAVGGLSQQVNITINPPGPR